MAITTLTSLSINVPLGKNIGNITDAINKTVIRGTPLQNSIKPMDEYLIIGREDLLPKAKNIPIGKQKSNAKIEMMKVNDSPPQAFVSTHTKPKFPPEIKEIAINGKTNNRKIIIYFLIFGRTKKAEITVPINRIKARFILHISALGYSPYTSLLIQTFIKIQQAPLPVHSSFVDPIKFASKNNQFKSPGIIFISIKITNRVRTAFNQFELIFLLSESKVLIPLNSILIK
jgi:hypothetical protein